MKFMGLTTRHARCDDDDLKTDGNLLQAFQLLLHFRNKLNNCVKSRTQKHFQEVL
jgi:hypothetical protein